MSDFFLVKGGDYDPIPYTTANNIPAHCTQFSVVVCDQVTQFISGPRVL